MQAQILEDFYPAGFPSSSGVIDSTVLTAALSTLHWPGSVPLDMLASELHNQTNARGGSSRCKSRREKRETQIVQWIKAARD